MKTLKEWTGSICGFDVILFKGITYEDCENGLLTDKVNELIDNEDMHKMEFFSSYSEAEKYLLDMMEEENEFYYGMIDEFRYDLDFEADPDRGFGECEEYVCVAEAWAEDQEE